MKTIEKVIGVTVANTTTGTSVTATLPPGEITHVSAFFRDYSAIQAGFIRASIKDVNGEEVSEIQSIENYRDREAGYLDAKKPLPIEGGKQYTITIVATAAFTGDFLADFVFVYKDQDKC